MDLYNYKKRVGDTIAQYKQSNDQNLQIVVEFTNKLIAENLSYARIWKYIQSLREIDRRLGGKSFVSVTKLDIQNLVSELNTSHYSEWTKHSYRVVIKRFWKWLKGDENYPDSTISVRYARLGLKGKRAQETVQEVVTSKYAEIVEEAIEGSKSAKYLVLTQQAIDWLKTQEVDVSNIQHIGRVGPLHSLYQNILQAYLKRLGWNVKHDFAIGDKFVDVFAEMEKKVAFEIAVSDVVNASRVVTALDSVDEYVFLCRDIMVINSIRSQIRMESHKIKYFVANQYLARLKKDILDYNTYSTENNQNRENSKDSNSDDAEQEKNRGKP